MENSRIGGKKRKETTILTWDIYFCFYYWHFFSSLLESNQNETADKPELKDSLQNNGLVIFKSVKPIEWKKDWETSRSETAREIWLLNAKHNLIVYFVCMIILGQLAKVKKV